MVHLTVFFTLCAAAILAPIITAKPAVIRDSPVTLPLARHFNTTAVLNILERDQARAKVLKAHAHPSSASTLVRRAGVYNTPATDQGTTYTTSVGIGTPPTFYTLLVDTGSANIWIGADTPYHRTSSSVDTGDSVSVTYGSGSFSGEEFVDTVTIGSLVVKGQSIGVARVSEGFQGIDGVLGLGPDDLTEDTVSSLGIVPTVLDNAFAQGLINPEALGVSFEPTVSIGQANGELTFGGVDASKYTGSLAYVPITSTSPASLYVGIDQSVTYGSAGTQILLTTAGIVDTGTTLVLLASDAFARYQQATGAVLDNNTGLLKLTVAEFGNLQSLFFNIGGTAYEFTANAQIWPRSLNTLIGGNTDSVYLIVASIGTPSGEGLDFINGFAFLQRFYHVFDVTNHRAGFATTQFTHATTN